MRQHFRPYSIVIHTSNIKNGVGVDLKDSAGDLLECNYISLTVSGGSDIGHVRMAADFPNLITPSGNFETPTEAIGTTASGVPSVYTVVGGEAGTMVLSDRDRVSSVNIRSNEGTDAILIVTYGQVSVGNNLRDQERPVGD